MKNFAISETTPLAFLIWGIEHAKDLVDGSGSECTKLEDLSDG